jgi:hypothetical protein
LKVEGVVTLFWTYRVPDFDSWSTSFKWVNEDDPLARERRRKYGMVNRWVYRSVDDPSEVMLVAQFSSREGAEALMQDPDGLRLWQQRTGVEVFPPVLITEELEDLAWTTSQAG